MNQKINQNKKPILAGLIAVVGLSAASFLTDFIPAKEGVILKGYVDPVGIPTKCMGDTRDVIVGKEYTFDECLISMETGLINHAKPVLACTPVLKDHPEALAAAVSFAYNFGPFAYCNSSIAYHFNKGDYKTACERFNQNAEGKPQWIYAGCKIVIVDGRQKKECVPLKGLIIRRAEERAMCERGFGL
jgi:lysozyme